MGIEADARSSKCLQPPDSALDRPGVTQRRAPEGSVEELPAPLEHRFQALRLLLPGDSSVASNSPMRLPDPPFAESSPAIGGSIWVGPASELGEIRPTDRLDAII